MQSLYLILIGLLSIDPPTHVHLPSDVEFFEKKVRPLLVEHCYECHGEQKQQASLRLDHPDGWLQGGDTGPALIPGKPEESLLMLALAYKGELDMPPRGKLPEESIRLIDRWIARGAPAPSISVDVRTPVGIDIDAGRQWWAYQPIRDGSLPDMADAMWPCHAIDQFISQQHQRVGLQPRPDASRGTLLRRLSIDLLGLPPAIEDQRLFESAEEPDAYERVIDRYLASPRYAERWARHWLDIVRFAESLTLRGFILPQAWRYRDYVFDVFNEDRPFADFLREQIAGDLLSAETIPDRSRQLVATTFWTLGNTNLEEQDKKQLDWDVIDEQIDVLGKSLLAQTISCARCHDHKFDPIPARDYYALAGILANTKVLDHENVSKWTEIPLPLDLETEQKFDRLKSEEQNLKTQVASLRKALDRLSGDLSIVAASDLPGIVIDDEQAEKVGPWTNSTSNKPYIGAGYVHDSDAAKGDKTISFVAMLPQDGRYEVRLAYSAGSNRATKVPVTVFHAEGETTIQVDMKAKPPIDGRFLSLGDYRFESAGQCYVLISNEGTTGHVTADAAQFLSTQGSSQTPVATKPTSASSAQINDLKDQLQKTEKQLKIVLSQLASQPRVMTLVERATIRDSHLFVRGSVHQPGEIVARGFLQVVDPPLSTPMSNEESGRRALADWITAAENPLTTRVYVNRLWGWIFGTGIVASVDNFGKTGEKPSHPELLDYMSMRFLEGGGSTKSAVRSIVESRTYRQACIEERHDVDPGNRLLAGMRVRRLDAEAIRDSMLAASGDLRLEVGGNTIKDGTVADYGYTDSDSRRSLYVPVLRNALADFRTVFDFPDPGLVAGERTSSNIPTQSLYLMNHPFVIQRSQETARRLLAENRSDDERLDLVFNMVLSRSPTDAESRLMHDVLGQAVDPLVGWSQVSQLLFESIDFHFYR
jgi:hypothetical protein